MTDPSMVFPNFCAVLQEVFNLLPNRENFSNDCFSSSYHSSLAPPIFMPLDVLLSSPAKASSAMLNHLMDNLTSPAGLFLNFRYRSERGGARQGFFRQDKRHDARDLHFITCVLQHPPKPRPLGPLARPMHTPSHSSTLALRGCFSWSRGSRNMKMQGTATATFEVDL